MAVPKKTGNDGELTLRELCRRLNISRRTVQGYEAHGLVMPTGKTDRGYLLYDESAQQRVLKIRRYQKYGFQIKAIAGLLDAPDEVLAIELEKRLSSLREEEKLLRQTMTELEAELSLLKTNIK